MTKLDKSKTNLEFKKCLMADLCTLIIHIYSVESLVVLTAPLEILRAFEGVVKKASGKP
jgi:hypothetical protein